MTTVEMTLAVELVESSFGEAGGRSLLFAYDSAAPLSVSAEGFEFGRDLLRDALERSTAGAGDVKFINYGPSVLMHVETPDDYATYLFDRGDLRAFLRRTQQVVEFGSEVLGIPDDPSALVKDGAR